MYIPNHAVHKNLIKYAQEKLIRWHVFHSWSYISGTGNTHIIFLSTFLKNSWSHLYSHSITGQKSWWNEGPYVQVICVIIRVGIYKNRPMWGGSNQIYTIRHATKSAVFAATDSGLGNANLHEAICAHHCMYKTKTNKKKKQGSFWGKKRKRGKFYLDIRLLGLYYCDADLGRVPKKKKVDRISYELKHICILLVEESLQWKLHCSLMKRELKTIALSLQGELPQQVDTRLFFLKKKRVTVIFVNVQQHFPHSWKAS